MPASSIRPKPPVTWILSVELNDVEREAFARFFYNLKDGIIDTKLSEHDRAVFANRADEIYETLEVY